jgi:hypothetical protein
LVFYIFYGLFIRKREVSAMKAQNTPKGKKTWWTRIKGWAKDLPEDARLSYLLVEHLIEHPEQRNHNAYQHHKAHRAA